MLDVIQNFDISAVRFIHENLSCGFLDFFMPLVTLLGEGGIFWIAVTLVLLCFKKTRRAGLVMAVSLAIGLVAVNLTLKPLVARPRPYTVDENVKLLVNKLSDYSFPSGHTLACFECSVALLICGFKKWGGAALTFAFLVAFSRLYLYVHYPTDVLTGMALGTAFAFFAKYVVDKLYAKYEK